MRFLAESPGFPQRARLEDVFDARIHITPTTLSLYSGSVSSTIDGDQTEGPVRHLRGWIGVFRSRIEHIIDTCNESSFPMAGHGR